MMRKTLLQPSTLLLATTELSLSLSLSQSSSSSTLHLRAYSKAPAQPTHRKKKLSPSFKPGPFKGALLDQTTTNHQTEIPRQDERQTRIQQEEPPKIVRHEYSPSQLVKSLKPNSTESNSKLHFPHSDSIQSHLKDLLYPLTFSDLVACRIVSCKNLVKSQLSLDLIRSSTPNGIGFALLGEHNTKFSFIGRRVMHFALSNFLIHAPRIEGGGKKTNSKMMSEVIEEALLTKFVLGQYVGHQWELEKIMRWRELAPSNSDPSHHSTETKPQKILPLSTGLWTARGHVVEAILGAVMTQYGARLSNAIFNSLVLPHLSFRLDASYLPAIKAIQTHDRELDNPKSGLVDWNQLDIHPFISNHHDTLDHLPPPPPPPSSSSSARSSIPIAAVG